MYRILIVDRDKDFRVNLSAVLQSKGFTTSTAGNIETAKQLLQEEKFQFLLYQEDDFFPVETLFKFLQEDMLLRFLPVCVLAKDKKQKEKYFQLGAMEVLIHPFEIEELLTRIQNLVDHAYELEQTAFRDPLTKVYNRRYFEQQLRYEMERARRLQTPVSLSFTDADRFKSINDTFGHHVGDLVLQGLANLIQRNLRGGDILGRFGGEEFVVLMPGCSGQDAYQKINSILEQARREPVAVHDGDQQRFVTFSAGVCEWRDGMSLEEWIKLADDAAYEAKLQGRNQVILSGQNGKKKGERKKGVILVDQRGRGPYFFSDELEIFETSSHETMETLKNNPIEICVINIQHAELEAFSFVEKIKTDYPHMKVVVISEEASNSYLLSALRVGADHFLQHPYSDIDLEIALSC
ncbi:GGDEF domain-containing response regulator [Paenibacillus tyrfis]|uniref:GGDEF domain-containing response regulator n=1 Tax=Paenibacillus tyrfis TaxID=1501230 RepID=UPI0020A1459C|nr:diguanylate cyclase [Paenibacillus tyrfis]MCP1312088.1 diguanylate cyclase [Paenibacillus tyrfis]